MYLYFDRTHTLSSPDELVKLFEFIRDKAKFLHKRIPFIEADDCCQEKTELMNERFQEIAPVYLELHSAVDELSCILEYYHENAFTIRESDGEDWGDFEVPDLIYAMVEDSFARLYDVSEDIWDHYDRLMQFCCINPNWDDSEQQLLRLEFCFPNGFRWKDGRKAKPKRERHLSILRAQCNHGAMLAKNIFANINSSLQQADARSPR